MEVISVTAATIGLAIGAWAVGSVVVGYYLGTVRLSDRDVDARFHTGLAVIFMSFVVLILEGMW